MSDSLFTATVVLKGKPKFRRAGVGFSEGENQVTVTEEQLDQIKQDPSLLVLTATDAPAASDSAPQKPETKDKAPAARQTKADKANN